MDRDLRQTVGLVALVLTLTAAPAAAGPVEDANAAFHQRDFATAHKLFLPLADQGEICAQWKLGQMYSEGLGVPKNNAEAERWFRKAAEQGDAPALGLALDYALASMYENGWFLEQNYEEAAKWYRRAAQRGHADAQHSLGAMHFNGDGIPLNYLEALTWSRKAAEQGHARAQTTVGVIYSSGLGVPEDHSEAIKWFQKAADQGVGHAQYRLGFAYGTGEGVPKNAAMAAQWYRRAADQGHSAAQRGLGTMYANGQEGILQDYVSAHMWFNLAAANGLESAANDLARIVRFMTPAQISEAQKLAREWKPVR